MNKYTVRSTKPITNPATIVLRADKKYADRVIFKFNPDRIDKMIEDIKSSIGLPDQLVFEYEIASYGGNTSSSQFFSDKILPYLERVAPLGTKFGESKINQLAYGYWTVPDDYVEVDEFSTKELAMHEIEKWAKYIALVCDQHNIDLNIKIDTHHHHQRNVKKRSLPIKATIVYSIKDEGDGIADWYDAETTTVKLEIDNG